LDRHPDPFLDPLGSVVYEIAVWVSYHQHVNVVWGSARLTQIACGPRTDQQDRFSPRDAGELFGDHRRRAVGGNNDPAHRVVQRMIGAGAHLPHGTDLLGDEDCGPLASAHFPQHRRHARARRGDQVRQAVALVGVGEHARQDPALGI
jgi:hypothetical protein